MNSLWIPFSVWILEDTIVHSISTVMLDPTGGTAVQHIDNIKEVIINGQELGLGGYLDIGLKDTMKDLILQISSEQLYFPLSVISMLKNVVAVNLPIALFQV